MTQVFVLDRHRQPLDPCHPARARELLRDGRAAVLRRFPFTIILHDRKKEKGTDLFLATSLEPFEMQYLAGPVADDFREALTC